MSDPIRIPTKTRVHVSGDAWTEVPGPVVELTPDHIAQILGDLPGRLASVESRIDGINDWIDNHNKGLCDGPLVDRIAALEQPQQDAKPDTDEAAVQAIVDGMKANTGTMHGMAIGALAAVRAGKVPGIGSINGETWAEQWAEDVRTRDDQIAALRRESAQWKDKALSAIHYATEIADHAEACGLVRSPAYDLAVQRVRAVRECDTPIPGLIAERDRLARELAEAKANIKDLEDDDAEVYRILGGSGGEDGEETAVVASRCVANLNDAMDRADKATAGLDCSRDRAMRLRTMLLESGVYTYQEGDDGEALLPAVRKALAELAAAVRDLEYERGHNALLKDDLAAATERAEKYLQCHGDVPCGACITCLNGKLDTAEQLAANAQPRIDALVESVNGAAVKIASCAKERDAARADAETMTRLVRRACKVGVDWASWEEDADKALAAHDARRASNPSDQRADQETSHGK